MGIFQMSLINQMLQELDARGTHSGAAGLMQGQVRVVPERAGMRIAVWMAAMLAAVALAAGAWWWQGKSAPASVSQETKPSIQAEEFSLKIAPELKMVPLPEVTAMPANLASPVPVAENKQQAVAAPVMATLDIQSKERPAASQPSPATASIPPIASAPSQQAATVPDAAASAKKTGAAADVKAADTGIPATLTKQVKELTVQQKAENAYRSGATLIQQGKGQEAIGMLEQALQFDAYHVGARQALVALLIESRRKDEAIKRLREGLQLDAGQTGFAMILARLQVDRGETGAAIDTLQKSLPHSERTEHVAFLAALLQRESRHKEAVEQYRAALSKSPQNGVWWMGMGISLQAENRIGEAADAYAHAKSSGNLSPELRAFVEEKLTGLQR